MTDITEPIQHFWDDLSQDVKCELLKQVPVQYFWDSLPLDIKIDLSKQLHATMSAVNRTKFVKYMKTKSSDIPQYTEDDIQQRMGRTTRLVQDEMEKKIQRNKVSIEMINPFLSEDGELMNVRGGEFVTLTIQELHIVAEVLQVFGVFHGIDHFSNLGRVRQLVYMVMANNNIGRKRALGI
eukprot:scaffold117683_cov46-Cyclotella_meneghiniana.AAC.11